MTNKLGATMASFMTKKKKYKFQVTLCLEELLEVPFVSGVLFAKLRLLDGGNFQDHSGRVEVKDHKVKWDAKFNFPCKMLANASTGVLERCILRISIRKEIKGGRSFKKLGFVDLNLPEFAGSGTIFKKALLEGYDTRNRQDNSIVKYSIMMNMMSGDVLFKVPTSQHAPTTNSDDFAEPRSSSGSIASGSSGFGSLPKKRTTLLTETELLSDPKAPLDDVHLREHEILGGNDLGHSRNSSNTSQSKASGYSSMPSHSRQSSSGDFGQRDKNHSSGSLVGSESDSLERMRAERRKKNPMSENDIPGRVEFTRVNPDDLIEDLLKNTSLEPAESLINIKI